MGHDLSLIHDHTHTMPRPVRTDDELTMAMATARTRWPGIVQNMVDDVKQSVTDGGDETEGENIVKALEQLKGDIESDKALKWAFTQHCANARPLTDDDGGDIQLYNHHPMIRSTWLATEWLFAECYLYR